MIATLDTEVPKILPVEHLSYSSINLFESCPLRWKHRYIDRIREPANPFMVIGTAVDKTYSLVLDRLRSEGEVMRQDEALALLRDEWKAAIATDVVWDEETPEAAGLEHAVRAMTRLTSMAPPLVESIQRKITYKHPDAEWTIVGFPDYELVADSLPAVCDLKVKGKNLYQKAADIDLQASMMLLARREEGKPADRFEFHVVRRDEGAKTPTSQLTTTRTNVQLDATWKRVASAARRIARCAEYDDWPPARVDDWKCADGRCHFWETCEFGGKR